MKKYLLISGVVFGKYDNDAHYISAQRLCRLYDLNPKDCVLVNNERDLAGRGLEEGMIILRPRHNGDYREHLIEIISKRKG